MENDIKKHQCSSTRKGIFFGILIVLTGIVLLAMNFNWIDVSLKPVIFSWPMLLVVFGFISLSHRNYVATFILICLGIFFLLPKLSEIYPHIFPGIRDDFSSLYWPILLIIAGILFLLHLAFPRKLNRKRHPKHNNFTKFKHHSFDENENTKGFEKKIVFGGEEHIFLDEKFPGGDINTIFGGIKLDLRKTHLDKGDTYIFINAVFSGITLYIPEDWSVDVRLDKFMGGFEDKRIINNIPEDTSHRLILKGSCVLAGVEIK